MRLERKMFTEAQINTAESNFLVLFLIILESTE